MGNDVRVPGAVAIVAPVSPPLGGMALQAELLRRELAAEGIRVSVIPTNPRLPRALSHLKGIRTLVQSVIYVALTLRALPQAEVVHVFGASYFYFFFRVAPALLIARLMGKRVVLNYRGGAAPEFFARYGWAARPIVRLAQAVTAPSAYLARFFIERGVACSIVPNIIESERFKFRLRDVLQPRLLVSRNLEPMYNVDLALRVFEIVKQRYPNARLDILGSGSQEARLKKRVAESELADVFFHGSVRNEDVPRFLDQSDILLNPTNVDNFPMSLLEAFASGVPVVSTDVGGIRDLLGKSEAAILVRANDHVQMADAICRLLRDPATACGMSKKGGKLARQFSWPCIRKSLLKAYYPDQEVREPAAAPAEEEI